MSEYHKYSKQPLYADIFSLHIWLESVWSLLTMGNKLCGHDQ